MEPSHAQARIMKAARTLLLSAIFATGSLSASAQTGGQLGVGARAAALGESFVGIADDGNAVYWNPAGLTSLHTQEANFGYSEPFGLSVGNSYLSYATPLTDRFSLGSDWLYLGFEDSEMGFRQHRLGLSMGYRPSQWIAVGATLKRHMLDAKLDGREIVSGSGWGADLGLLLLPASRLKIGLVVQDVGDSRVEYQSGQMRRLYSANPRLGLAYRMRPEWLLVAGLDEAARLGTEYQLHPALTLRAGIQHDLENDTGTTPAFGLGLNFRFIRLDYAYTASPDLGGTYRTSLALRFNFSSSDVTIADFALEDLFPGAVRRYQREKIGSVKLTNTSDRPVDASIELFIPEIMRSPTEMRQTVAPGSTQTVTLTARLGDLFSRLDRQRTLPAKVEISYRKRGRIYSVRETIPVRVYSSNALRWEDIAEAVAFVNPDDREVGNFAREALQAEPVSQTGIWKNGPLRQARQLFQSLSTLGIRYRPDPHTPFGQITFRDSTVDHIHGPGVLLSAKEGDCDDLAVLYCSLLEHAGTATALIQAPGHLYMAFDTGISPTEAHQLGIAESSYIASDGRAWIPIEIRMLGQSFQNAWDAAIEEYLRLNSRGRIQFVQVRTAWQTYPPMATEREE